VRGTGEIDYDSIVKGVGLTLEAKQNKAGKAYIGANIVEDNGRLSIRSIPAGSPAYEQGLNTGDHIVAVDGYRASQSFLQSYIEEKKPNDKVKLTVFRFDKLREITFTLGDDLRRDYDFSPVEAPDDAQKQLYKQYLNAEL
jgi:predicted metalloprotease with PDZ domain